MQKHFYKLNTNIQMVQQLKRTPVNGSEMPAICKQSIRYTMKSLASVIIIDRMDTVFDIHLFIIEFSSVSDNFVWNLAQLHPFMCKIFQSLFNLVKIVVFDVFYYCILVKYNVCKVFYYLCLFFFI